jgi:hypothetical protein
MTLPDLAGLIAALNDGGVRFVVIGGIAVSAHGHIRATEDLDIVPAPDRDNLERLGNTLVGLGARVAGDTSNSTLDPVPNRLLVHFEPRSDLGDSEELLGLGHTSTGYGTDRRKPVPRHRPEAILDGSHRDPSHGSFEKALQLSVDGRQGSAIRELDVDVPAAVRRHLGSAFSSDGDSIASVSSEERSQPRT